jgi:hypothetical protein
MDKIQKPKPGSNIKRVNVLESLKDVGILLKKVFKKIFLREPLKNFLNSFLVKKKRKNILEISRLVKHSSLTKFIQVKERKMKS